MAVLFYHFAIRYTVTKINEWIIPCLYFICFLFIPFAPTSLVISGMQIKPYGYAPIFGPVGPFWLLFTFGMLFTTLAVFIGCYSRSTDSQQRNRIAYIITGVSLALLGGIFDVLPLFGLPLYPGAILGNIAFCVLTTIAIVRNNLLDIHVVARRGTNYALIGIIVAIPLLALYFLLAISVLKGNMPIWVYIIPLIILAVFASQISAPVQQWIDRILYRQRYRFLRALEAFHSGTQSLADYEKLTSTMINLVSGVMSTPMVALLQPISPNGDFYLVANTDIANDNPGIIIKRRSSLITWLQNNNGVLSHQDIDFIPQLQRTSSQEKEILWRIGAHLIVPLKTHPGYLSGVLIIGEKASSKPYTTADKQLVQGFSSQMAMKLENIQLYHEAVQARQELKALARRLVEVQEEERHTIARELHDETGQLLISAKLLLEKSRSSQAGNMVSAMNEAQDMLREAIRQIREMSLNLRPGMIDDLGLLPALHWYLEQYTRRTNIQVNFKHSGLKSELQTDIRTAAYRIVQEALNNVARHAKVKEATARVWVRTGTLYIQIEDAGTGFDPTKIPATSSGIRGIRERALMFGGRLVIDSAPGEGTLLRAELPINRGEKKHDNDSDSG